MSTLKLTTLSNQGGTASVPSETVINGTAKAWVSFNGTGTPTINRSFNVSSITDNGTGRFQLNFTTAMQDANYCCNVTGDHNAGVYYINGAIVRLGTITTTSVEVNFYNNSVALQDVTYAAVSVLS